MNKACSLILIFLGYNLYAQEAPEKKRMHYFFSVNSGMLAGKSGEYITYSANTIHGLAVGKRLRGGLGVGIDTYDQWQALPIFGSFSYDILNHGSNGLFVQVNYGWSHAWMQKQEGIASTTAGGGKMFNAMMGYRIMSGNLTVSIAVGYKFQYVHDNQIYWYNTYALIGPYPGYQQRTDMDLERFVFTVGIGWR